MAEGSSPTSTAAEFDTLAASYERGRLARWYEAQAELTLEVIAGDESLVVVDVGCGSGWLLRRLVEMQPDARGVGIDVSKEMIREACRRAERAGLEGQLAFLEADWLTLDPARLDPLCGSRSVTTVTCVSAFHYFDRPRAAAKRFFEVLGEGGRLLLFDRQRDRSMLTVIWQAIHRLLRRRELRYYGSGQLVEILRQVGFRDVRIVRSIRRLLWRGKLFTSLVLISARKCPPNSQVAPPGRGQGR